MRLGGERTGKTDYCLCDNNYFILVICGGKARIMLLSLLLLPSLCLLILFFFFLFFLPLDEAQHSILFSLLGRGTNSFTFPFFF